MWHFTPFAGKSFTSTPPLILPRHIIAVCVARSLPVLIDTRTNKRTIVNEALPQSTLHAVSQDSSERVDDTVADATAELDFVVAWDPTGCYLFVGTSRGAWQVVEHRTMRRVFSDRLAGSAIRHFAFSRSGQYVSITVGDKSIRTYHLPYAAEPLAAVSFFEEAKLDKTNSAAESRNRFECVPILKLQDLVNRHMWCSSAWSANEQFIVGATAGRAHCISIWNWTTGALVKLLEGPPEPVTSFAVRLTCFGQSDIL